LIGGFFYCGCEVDGIEAAVFSAAHHRQSQTES